MHLLTASGAVWGLFAVLAIGRGDYGEALRWMLVATLVDAIDGPLARAVDVKRALPGFDGAKLDDLIDYVNYAFVPAYLIHAAALLPAGFGPIAAAAICLAAAYQFAQRDAKTPDHLFKGFPSYWNLVVFYLLVLRPAPWVAGIVIAICGVLTFVPVYCVYPSRTPWLRGPTLGLGVVWGAAVAATVLLYPDAPRWLAPLSLVFVVYYSVVSLILTVRRQETRST